MNGDKKFKDIIKAAWDARDYADALNRAMYGVTHDELLRHVAGEGNRTTSGQNILERGDSND